MIPVENMRDNNSDYYKAALEWEAEKYESAVKGRKAGWIVAMILLMIVLFLSMALAGLTPLKTVEPYTIEVNTLTGETRVARALEDGNITQSEALVKYWIIQYVRARETYDRQDIEQGYTKVKMLSEKNEFGKYAKAFDPNKPDSPYQVYGETTKVRVDIKSIAFLDDDTASIRVDLIEDDGDREFAQPWIITMSFQFTLQPLTEEERFDNPLGFQATSYRKDAEVVSGE